MSGQPESATYATRAIAKRQPKPAVYLRAFFKLRIWKSYSHFGRTTLAAEAIPEKDCRAGRKFKVNVAAAEESRKAAKALFEHQWLLAVSSLLKLPKKSI